MERSSNAVPTRIRGLIFDFDGLILDTEVPDYQSWVEVYDEYGCDLPLAVWATCIGSGLSTFNPYDYLEAQLGRPVDRAAVRARRRQRMAELVAAQPIQSGIVEYLADARRLDLRLAVASSSPRSWVEGHLTRLGLRDAFACLCCGDEVRRTKPDPELYLTALRTLDLQPEQAIALEDSPNGALAAKRAGLYCVVVPNPLTSQLLLDYADRRLTSLVDLPLERLLRAVSEVRKGEADAH